MHVRIISRVIYTHNRKEDIENFVLVISTAVTMLLAIHRCKFSLSDLTVAHVTITL